MSVQPAVEQPAQSIAEEDGCGNDETDLGVSGRGDQRIGLGWAIWIFGILIFRHDENDFSLTDGTQTGAPSIALAWTAEASVST